MANIRCYTYDDDTGVLTLLGIVDDFTSFSFTRKESDIGDWTLVLNGYSLNTIRTKGTQIISVSDGVAGLVLNCVESFVDGNYTVTYTGKELKYIASQRIIVPEAEEAYQEYRNVSPEYVIAQLITQHILTTTDTDRAIAGALHNYTEGSERINFSGRFDNVATAIQTVAGTHGIRWYADIQDNVITWHIGRGVDRRKSQDVNSRMIVSYKLDSFGSSTVSNSGSIPNVALVAGQGEGVERATTIVGAGKGLSRAEVYIDARDIADETLLPERGAQKLAEYGDNLTYEATFSQSFINQYRNPYDLGDIGTIEDDRLPSGEIDFKITAITEVYEGDNLRLDVVFGYDRKGLVETINRSVGSTQSLINLESVNPKNLYLKADNKLRWAVYPSTDAETGSSAGSNFNIARYDDDGDYIDAPFSINRQTGVASFTQLPKVGAVELADKNYINNLIQSVPVGAIMQWPSNTVPTGYLLCDGSAVSRTDYAALFAVVGTTYGTGDGSTTFNLPNLKGRIPVGRDTGQSEFDTLGETGGEKTHTLTTAEMPAHKHNQTYTNIYFTSGSSAAAVDRYQGTTATISDAQMSNTGGGGAHNNLQPYIVINYIIKAVDSVST